MRNEIEIYVQRLIGRKKSKMRIERQKKTERWTDRKQGGGGKDFDVA